MKLIIDEKKIKTEKTCNYMKIRRVITSNWSKEINFAIDKKPITDIVYVK